MFWGFSNNTGESILYSLEAVSLGDVYVQEDCLVRRAGSKRLDTGQHCIKGIVS